MKDRTASPGRRAASKPLSANDGKEVDLLKRMEWLTQVHASPQVSATAKTVAFVLFKVGVTGRYWAGNAKLGAALGGKSNDTVTRGLKELDGCGFISSSRSRRADGRLGRSQITLMTPCRESAVWNPAPCRDSAVDHAADLRSDHAADLRHQEGRRTTGKKERKDERVLAPEPVTADGTGQVSSSAHAERTEVVPASPALTAAPEPEANDISEERARRGVERFHGRIKGARTGGRITKADLKAMMGLLEIEHGKSEPVTRVFEFSRTDQHWAGRIGDVQDLFRFYGKVSGAMEAAAAAPVRSGPAEAAHTPYTGRFSLENMTRDDPDEVAA